MKRMKKGVAAVILVIFVAIVAALGFYSYTVLSPTEDGRETSLKLGLDLAGGVSITYHVVGDTPTQEQMDDTIHKLKQRIENDLGEQTKTTEAAVYPVGTDRITVEIPGVTDANAMLEELGAPGQLFFIKHLDPSGNENYVYDPETGKFVLAEGKDIATLEEEGSIVLTGAEVKNASAVYQQNELRTAQEPVVQLTLDEDGTEAFAEATAEAYANDNDTIGIYYDGEFVSVPAVQAEIADGNAIINGMEDYDAANDLASYIRIGGLDLELEELQSEVVGAQLGSDALSTSLIAAGIGLIIVFIFMIAMYWIPGLLASLALILYTELIISILNLFEITLTLPGIAGIILSIGMAVDANVIVFARIREEIRDGKNIWHACANGFHRALSAILDGNITTLIAAAVLGIFGTGTVKGFAITLALGVVLSMFSALFVTRLLMRTFLSLGIDNPKYYGKAKFLKTIDFIGKRGVFFFISIAVIAAGIIGMSVSAVNTGDALNYSLEFKGGTSTTVSFEKEYSIDEIDSKIVPVISEAIGSNDIQTQKVNDGTDVIIKTQTLELEQREALNQALEDNFGVTEADISSESIGSTISDEMWKTSILAVIIAVALMLIYIWIRFRDVRFASSAVIALFHDVLVVLTVYALAHLSVGSAFIACILTVIGYSINDTIVIFDRIRENYAGIRNDSKEELTALCNESITQTLTRSISTSITTAITVLMLLILGVTTVKEFAFPLLIGVICGTYSSICIATELWFVMKIRFRGKSGLDKAIAQKPKKKAVKATKENQGLVV